MFVRPLVVVAVAVGALLAASSSGASSRQDLPVCLGQYAPAGVATDTRGLSLMVSSSPLRPRARRQVRWLFQIVNSNAEPRTVEFPTNQMVDVELRRHGTVRHRWSWGKGFFFMVSRHEFPAESVWSCHVSGKLAVKPGRYVLTAWLNGWRTRGPIVQREIAVRR